MATVHHTTPQAPKVPAGQHSETPNTARALLMLARVKRASRLLAAFALSPYCDLPIAVLLVLFIALSAAGVV